jgi:hypothetical protein
MAPGEIEEERENGVNSLTCMTKEDREYAVRSWCRADMLILTLLRNGSGRERPVITAV